MEGRKRAKGREEEPRERGESVKRVSSTGEKKG
jgi:hypothetical protein